MGAARKAKIEQQSLAELWGDPVFDANGAPAANWAAAPHYFLLHKTRLARGKYQVGLIDVAWALTCGRRTVKAGPFPEITDWVPVRDIAEVLGCSEDQVWDDAREAGKRGLLGVKERRGAIQLQVLWKSWAKMPDYVPPKPVEVPKKEPKPATEFSFRRPILFKRGEKQSLETAMGILEMECVNLDSLRLHVGEAAGRLLVRFEDLGLVSEKRASKESVRCEDKPEPTPTTTPKKNLPKTADAAAVGVQNADVTVIANTFIQRGILADEKTIRQILKSCFDARPVCTAREVSELIEGFEFGPNCRSKVAVLRSQLPAILRSPHYKAGVKLGGKKESSSEMMDRLLKEDLEFQRKKYARKSND